MRSWETLLEHVHDGATLYLSLNDTILSGIDEIFGAGVRDRRMTNDTPEFRFDAGFSFTLPRRIRYRMNSYGAEVLGREADGNPAFFRHRYGKGTVYLLNFPLEAAAAGATGGFETDAWKLYREILHPRRLAESPSPFLQLTEHHFADGRAAPHRGQQPAGAVRGRAGAACRAAAAGPAFRQRRDVACRHPGDAAEFRTAPAARLAQVTPGSGTRRRAPRRRRG
ncbi:MAG: hypothetical protein L6W00_07280 [Lentisphaeria bacterium]|nr:MAG: hypothetical protein L6W00_07280 [Lentisphaeria bacterium]